MAKALLRRFIGAVSLALFITFFTFGIMKLSGDPLAELKLNPQISEARIKAESIRLGLNKSFGEQYLIWLGNLLKGDFGYAQNNQRVTDLIKPALINTLILNLIALITTWSIAIPLGVLAAIYKDTWIDATLTALTSFFLSIPGFIFAIFCLIFALYTGLFPIGGLTSVNFDELSFTNKIIDLARHLFLPVFILTCLGLVSIQRQMRGNLLDVLSEDYVRTARAKGLSEKFVFFKHALRNAVNPLVTLLGYEFSALFVGSALIEIVLSYPGLGLLTLEAARKLDTNLVLANLLLGSVMLILGNLIADLLLTAIDPRIKSRT